MCILYDATMMVLLLFFLLKLKKKIDNSNCNDNRSDNSNRLAKHNFKPFIPCCFISFSSFSKEKNSITHYVSSLLTLVRYCISVFWSNDVLRTKTYINAYACKHDVFFLFFFLSFPLLELSLSITHKKKSKRRHSQDHSCPAHRR